MMPDHLPPLRQVIRTHGIVARKSLGQNFILDLNLMHKIARAAGNIENTTVIEIGAGPGGLTRALLENHVRHVIAIECDPRAINALTEIARHYPSRLTVIQGDATKIGLESLAMEPVHIIANLPYNIATSLLVAWLTYPVWPPFFKQLVLMLQQEVVERITAKPGSKSYGRLSVLAQWRCTTDTMFSVPRTAFMPVPKVDSALVALKPRPKPIPCERRALEHITATVFGQRRKMLRSSLKQIIPNTEEELVRAGIKPSMRPETLSVEQFCVLARMISSQERNEGALLS